MLMSSSLFKRSSLLVALIASSPLIANANLVDSTTAYLQQGKLSVDVGWFEAHQGESQFIGIQDLIGDRFTLTKQNDNNFLVGAGYFLPAMAMNNINFSYGLNVFYLGDTKVKGNVIQEDIFENLSYRYSITNVPILFSAKAVMQTSYDWLGVNLDVGIGPNVIHAYNFDETSLDGVTLPDNIFKSNTTADFSATVGAGLTFNNALGCNMPIEVDYRFFYLGEGRLERATSQVSKSLRTGDSYANAVVVSFTIM